MAAVALIVSVAIAVGGWLVSQAQARRAARRNMRIDYLLDAYRRLERASNRPLTPDTAQELEAAVGDVMLLGSAEQAALAADFARKFVSEHVASTQLLLLALRDSLRRELLLGELPRSAYVSLRISTDGDEALDTSRVWREAVEDAKRSLLGDLGEVDATNLSRYIGSAPEVVESASPNAAVADSYAQVERLLRDLLADNTAEDIRAMPLPQLASRALQLGLIDARLADSIHNLTAMRMLAAMDQDRLTARRAKEFINLSTVIAYLIEHTQGASEPSA